jgi:mono/diheme cytochrome c family protein
VTVQTRTVLAVLLIIGIAILAYAVWGRAGRNTVAVPVESLKPIPVEQLVTMRPVTEIAFEYHQPDLPPGPGHDQFAAQCVICHSPRYVLNQPVFPRKTWTAEVQKMVKAYGAMIPPDQQQEIVNYLVYWHGKEDAPVAPAHNTR